ncbi:MAG: hypothetical protein ACT4P3_18960 [Betaproteobacteria bacterium]
MRGAVEFLIGIVGQTLLVVFLAGAVLALAVGLTLVFDSARALRWNERLSRWISTREAVQRFDRPRDIKRYVYRMHRVFGLAVVAGALYCLDVLTFGFSPGALARALRDLGSQGVLELAFESVRLFFIVGNLAALAAGVVLCFRPSLLKGVEAWADRAYLERTSARTLDEMRFQPDQWVSRHPRLAGALVLAGSAFILFGLGLRPLL